MDRPKRQVSWLESFPPDIWAYIVCYVPVDQLVRLMMTGAMYLRQRLKSYGVVKSIKLGDNLFDLKSLPAFFKEFPSLNEVSLPSYHPDNEGLCPALNSIPCGVRKLVITGEGNEMSLESFQIGKKLPYLQTFGARGVIIPLNWLTEAPQSLTQLSLCRWNFEVELPATLIDFETVVSGVSRRSLVSTLPPSLESFVVSSSLHGVDLLVPLLPPSIRTFCLGTDIVFSSRSLEAPRELFKRLPPSLTRLEIPYLLFYEKYHPGLIRLPSTLTDLSIGCDFPCSEWSLLPPHLTKLSFGELDYLRTLVSRSIYNHQVVDDQFVEDPVYHQIELDHHLDLQLDHHSDLQLDHGQELEKKLDHHLDLQLDHHSDLQLDHPEQLDHHPAMDSLHQVNPNSLNGTPLSLANHQLDSIPFDSLPKSITRLEVHSYSKAFCHPPNPSNLAYFPPQLTDLRIPSIQLSPEVTKLLPSTLTHLEIRSLCERICQHLPNTLKRLVAKSTLMSPNLLKHLPKALSYLRLSISRPDAQWLDYSTSNDAVSVPHITEYVMHEKWALNPFEWQGTLPLPPTLTYFCISNIDSMADNLGDTLLFHQQLPNLLEFEWDSKHFSDLSIPLLPRHLTTLRLTCSCKVSGKSFKLLPRGLTVLSLDAAESIFDCDIQHLPRTITTLYLKNAVHLTELCLPDLPPNLESLSIRGNSNITPSAFPSLPRSIQSSHCGGYAAFADWRVFSGAIKLD